MYRVWPFNVINSNLADLAVGCSPHTKLLSILDQIIAKIRMSDGDQSLGTLPCR